ncbi:MAG TPA: sugar ABC transporter permease [Limnochordia bacterium]|nr:sugar ABC transporter permease [Limnochordia bacterium]
MRLKPRQRQAIWAYVFLTPTLILFALIVIYPFLYAFYLSLQEWGVFGDTYFVGIQNYRDMLNDPLFWKSLGNTFKWTVGVVPATIIIALLVALILNSQRVKARGAFRTIYFVPVVTNMVAAAFVWRWLFEPTFGVVNYILERLGLPGPGWLASTKWALPAMMVVGIWKQIGFAMVIFLAGLQTIPRDIVEAARIDGATGWQVFSRITLPLLNPTVVFVAVMMVINALRVFTIPYVMSAGGFTYGVPGGPLDSTRVFVIHIYDLGFRRFQLGYASANAFALLILIMAATLFQMKVLERPFEY